MKRDRFLSDLRRFCRKNDVAFRVDTVAGKGGHSKVYVGEKATIVKSGDLSPTYVEVVLKQLGLPKDAL